MGVFCAKNDEFYNTLIYNKNYLYSFYCYLKNINSKYLTFVQITLLI